MTEIRMISITLMTSSGDNKEKRLVNSSTRDTTKTPKHSLSHTPSSFSYLESPPPK